jgi:hypothetical protein
MTTEFELPEKIENLITIFDGEKKYPKKSVTYI